MSTVSRFMETPSQIYFDAAKRILRDIAGTKGMEYGILAKLKFLLSENSMVIQIPTLGVTLTIEEVYLHMCLLFV